jgi:hypothetical protein
MNLPAIIELATGVAIASTATTLVTTIVHLWRRHRVSVRDAKFPQGGSRRLELDPDRPIPPPMAEADEPDADLLAPILDPDRPPPPSADEADQPDHVEEYVTHG